MKRFIEVTKQFFKPLTEKWFWTDIFPLLVGMAIISTLMQH